MKIRVFKVEFHSNDSPHARPLRALRHGGVVQGAGRHREHQQMLGQNVFQFVGRDAEGTQFDVEVLEVVARDILSAQQSGDRCRTVFPTRRRCRSERAAPVEDRFLKRCETFGLADMGLHADDGHRRSSGRNDARGRGGIVRVRRRFGQRRRRRRVIGPILLHQQMGIDPAEAESAHGRAARAVVVTSLPSVRRGLHPEGAAFQRAVGRCICESQRRRQRLVLHAQQNLDQTGHPGTCEQVTGHGFDRSDRALPRGGLRVLPQCGQALQFDAIPQRRARPVAFDQVDVRWLPAGLAIGFPHGP